MERTCVIVKPDGVGKHHIGDVIKRLESEGLKLLAMKMVRPAKERVEGFYDIHRGKPFFEPLVGFMTSGPIVAMAWEADNAVARVRTIIGATNSKEAAPGTLRNLFGTDNRRNLVHASDSPDNGVREIKYYFNDDEILSYDPKEWEKH